MTFFDQVASLCASELKSNPEDVIECLSTLLGRSIARSTGGDSIKNDVLLSGCENYIVKECADTSNFIKEIENLKNWLMQ